MNIVQRMILALSRRGLFDWMPDKPYLMIKYYACIGRKLNLKKPQSYSEKLQWLKLYNRKPEYTKMVDKYEVREFVKQVIGEEYLIPLLGVWDTAESIDFDLLPNQFVLKCTHDSGGIVICKDKTELDYGDTVKKMEEYLKRDFYKSHREWPYKNVKPRIIAEKYMVDESGTQLKDYKFFCFDGKVPYLFIATDRPHSTKFDFYDDTFNHLNIINGHPNSAIEIKKPDNFDKMVELASVLSKGMPHVRVDLYNINGKIYFGEMTFFHWSGLVPFEPERWDYEFGKWIEIPEGQKEFR